MSVHVHIGVLKEQLAILLCRPELFWEMSREMQSTIAKAHPNPAHITLAEMEKQNLVSCVITQNIDNLHKV
jgi:NAD-dependent deacetylase